MQPFANLPYSLCRHLAAKRIVTVGAPATVVESLTRGLHENRKRSGGLVVCADLDERRLGRIGEQLESVDLEDYAHLLPGDARSTLRGLEGPFDLVWLGCPNAAADAVLATLRASLRPSTCVIRRGARGAMHYSAA